MFDGRNRRSRPRDSCDGGGIASGSNQDRPCCCGVKSCNGDAPVAGNLALTTKGNTVALITGDSYSEYIYGYDEDDTIYAEGGNDTILPGTGEDFIDGGSGNNTISYLDYIAPWYVSGLIALYVDLASGTATTFIPSYNPNSDPNNLT